MKRAVRFLTVLLLDILLSTAIFASELFPHDLHAYFLPVPTAGGGESGAMPV